LRATPSRPSGTPPTLGKSTPPLAEWSPDTSTTSTASTTPSSNGLNKLELCQFYNVQQFPERDVPHDKQVNLQKQHNQQPLKETVNEKAKSPENEIESNPKIMVIIYKFIGSWVNFQFLFKGE